MLKDKYRLLHATSVVVRDPIYWPNDERWERMDQAGIFGIIFFDGNVRALNKFKSEMFASGLEHNIQLFKTTRLHRLDRDLEQTLKELAPEHGPLQAWYVLPKRESKKHDKRRFRRTY